MRRVWLMSMMAAVTFLAVGTVFAADTPRQIVQRQDMMKQMGPRLRALKLFGMGEGLPKGAETAAKELFDYARVMPDLFIAGSGQADFPTKTGATDKVFSDAAGFKAQIESFKTNSEKMMQLVAGNDRAGVLAQLDKIGTDNCIGCHNGFRGRY